VTAEEVGVTYKDVGGARWGHAGLFSTADDLGRLAQTLINGGQLDDVAVLKGRSYRSVVVLRCTPHAERQRI
jgi:CubicO group peptidase (beta-lactamase class C family)